MAVPAELLKRASHHRLLADEAADPSVREALLSVSLQLEEEAYRLERKEKGRPPPTKEPPLAEERRSIGGDIGAPATASSIRER